MTSYILYHVYTQLLLQHHEKLLFTYHLKELLLPCLLEEQMLLQDLEKLLLHYHQHCCILTTRKSN